MQCRHCGTVLSEDDLFCAHCGNIATAAPKQSPEAAIPPFLLPEAEEDAPTHRLPQLPRSRMFLLALFLVAFLGTIFLGLLFNPPPDIPERPDVDFPGTWFARPMLDGDIYNITLTLAQDGTGTIFIYQPSTAKQVTSDIRYTYTESSQLLTLIWNTETAVTEQFYIQSADKTTMLTYQYDSEQKSVTEVEYEFTRQSP